VGGKRLSVEALRAAAAAPTAALLPPPVEALVPAPTLADPVPADLPRLLALLARLPGADPYPQDEVEVALHPTLTRVWCRRGRCARAGARRRSIARTAPRTSAIVATVGRTGAASATPAGGAGVGAAAGPPDRDPTGGQRRSNPRPGRTVGPRVWSNARWQGHAPGG
jgi:hypothetical protein